MSTRAMRLVAAATVLALGIGAALAGEPVPRAESAASRRMLARAIEREEDHVTALELAHWIRDRKPGLRVLDLRDSASYDAYHVPTAERMSLEDVATARFDGAPLVLYSEGGAHAAQAWVLLRAAGVRDVWFLRGGLLEWMDDVMQPATSTELTRYFGGIARAIPSGVPLPDSAPAVVRRLRRRSC